MLTGPSQIGKTITILESLDDYYLYIDVEYCYKLNNNNKQKRYILLVNFFDCLKNMKYIIIL